MVSGSIVLAEFMNLSMTIMASGDAIGRICRLNLPIFKLSELQSLLLEAGLEKATAAAAAIIVGTVGLHVDKILFTNNRLNHETEVFRNGIAIAFANDLAGILNCKFDFKIFIPI